MRQRFRRSLRRLATLSSQTVSHSEARPHKGVALNGELLALAEKDLEMTAAPRVGEMFTFTTPDLGGLYASQDKSGPWHFRVQDIEYRLDTITREVYAVVPCSVVM